MNNVNVFKSAINSELLLKERQRFVVCVCVWGGGGSPRCVLGNIACLGKAVVLAAASQSVSQRGREDSLASTSGKIRLKCLKRESADMFLRLKTCEKPQNYYI